MSLYKGNWESDEEDEGLCFCSKGETIVKRFCLDSSLHGLKYVGQPNRHAFERIFWLGAFCVSGIGCIVVIITLWNKYWSSPIVTVFQPTETPIALVPFPAVTICNVNNVRKSRANQYIQKAKTENLTESERLQAYSNLYDLNHICEASTTFGQRFKVSSRTKIDNELMQVVLKERENLPGSTDPVQVLRKATQNCSELILLCLWLDEIQDCNTFFHGVETDYGFCCTFNVVPLTLLLNYANDSRDDPNTIKEWAEITKETGSNILLPAIETMHKGRNLSIPKYPYRQVYNGRSSGLSILLDPDLDEYFCKNTDAEGFVIGAGDPLDFPRVRDHGIAVRPNTETFMSIKPDLTIASPNIFSFDLETRQCYLANEFKLRFYAFYTASNCVDECVSNHTFQLCNCVQYYMPRSNDQLLCTPDQFICTERVRKEIVQNGLRKECHRCLPPCNDITYQVETSFLDMRDGVFLPGNIPRLNRTLNGKNMTIVHLYMGVESSYPRLRKELYSFIDLISSTGGLLSLCLGFSLLSVLEIFYFFTIRVFIRSYKKYQKRKSTGILSSFTQESKAHKQHFLSAAQTTWKSGCILDANQNSPWTIHHPDRNGKNHPNKTVMNTATIYGFTNVDMTGSVVKHYQMLK